MIAANELRPGNYIYKLRDIGQNQYEKVLFQVASIDDRYGHLENYDFDSTTTEFSEPISLTPEILEKWCGFEYSKLDSFNQDFFKFGKLDFAYNKGVLYFPWGGYEITALHQLQNVIYSLTGIELQIKLPATV